MTSDRNAKCKLGLGLFVEVSVDALSLRKWLMIYADAVSQGLSRIEVGGY